MPSLKPVVRKGKIKIDGKCRIFIRLYHNFNGKRQVSYIKTPWNIDPLFMGKDGNITSKYPGYTILNRALYAQLTKYNLIFEDIGPAIDDMPIKTLTSKLKGHGESGADFSEYTHKRITRLKAEKRFSYAESYKVMLTHLERHTKSEKVLFKEITVSFLREFEHYLFLQDCSVNTIRIYLNNIRAIFNHAIDNDVIKQELFPFRKFKIRQEKSEKRSLTINQTRALMIGPYLPAQYRSVHVFMLILYLIGINLKDLLYLKPNDYRAGRIFYRRRKTKELFSVNVPTKAREIIESYRGERYLLSFLDQDDSYKRYKDFLKETNKRLRIAAGYKVSTYYARHTFATIAYNECEYSTDQIGLALGHKGYKVTEGYISKDMAIVDKMQADVIGKLFPVLNGRPLVLNH